MKEGTTHTKIEDIEGDIVHLLHEDGTRSEKDIAPFPMHLRKIGVFVSITKTTVVLHDIGAVTYRYEKGKEFVLVCTCPTTCDCQNPPPENWDGKEGIYHCSESCPIHNENPSPNPDCPIHGE